MERKCERCQYNIDMTYLLKQENLEEILCPNCGRVLVATDVSKMLTISFFIMFFIIFCILPLRTIVKLIILVLWSCFSKDYLPAFLYLYREKNEEDF